jgi:hypothetical protein
MAAFSLTTLNPDVTYKLQASGYDRYRQSRTVLFPFSLTWLLAYVVSNSPNLDFRSEGPSNQFVALRTTL